MREAASFWDRVASKYAARPVSDPEAYEATLARTRSHLTLDMKVLEIGCGTGSTALVLAPHVAALRGTDISPEMVRIAREKARTEALDTLKFEVADALQAVEGAGDHQAVLAFNILHLVPDLERILSELHKALPRGALLISKTPCVAEPSIGLKRHLIALMIPLLQMLNKAPLVRRLSFLELEQAIGQAGFDIIETTTGPAMSRYLVARKPD